jgi:hypothetical protein
LLSLAVTLPAEFWRTNARGEQFKHTHSSQPGRKR